MSTAEIPPHPDDDDRQRTKVDVGTRLGAYVVTEKIARGGFGNVWKAREEQSGEEVAIKVLHAELVTSEKIVARFKREALAIDMARHPNVVELRDFGALDDERPYMVMEYLAGYNLDVYVKSEGALPPQRVFSILTPLCSALTVAHERGVIHRDLKASNVVLSESFNTERIVLLDFGIAKLLEDGGPQLTASRVAIGSPVCMAPEQIQGQPVDPRTDVYALGSLTFLMLTGELPFPGRSVDAMHQHLVAPRPLPSDRMDVSPAFDEVVARAMAKEPSDRYADVVEFLTAFERAMKSAGTNPRDPRRAPSPILSPGMSRLCIGLYVDVQVPDEHLRDPDDTLLDDLDRVFPLASGFLQMRGFLLAYESGDSALFVMPLPEQVAEETRLRARIFEHARELARQLAARADRDPRVQVGLHLHVAEATIAGTMVTEGSLLDVTSWVERIHGEGIAATPAALRGLAIDVNSLL